MKQIYYSENQNIAFDSKSIEINGKTLPKAEEDSDSFIAENAYKKMREIYSSILSRQYENIVVLSGSGTSFEIGTNNKYGKIMSGLWKSVVEKIGFDELEAFANIIKYKEINRENTDLEALLSKALVSQSFLDDQNVESTINQIKSVIKEECSLDLPDDAPHIVFLRKLTARKLKYSRVKIFTLNYDLLFEQAASRGGYVVIDGFSFSYPRIFNGVNYDYDIVSRSSNRALSDENFVTKVFHLYKPHGSLDWEKTTSDNGESEKIVKADNPTNPLMIYPSNSKYEYSYEQPYFEMTSRFQQELRNKNTLLLVLGFSFYDKHIKAMVYEALNINPSITVVVVSPSIQEENTFVELKKESSTNGNLHLVNETFRDFVKNYPSSEIYDYSKEGWQHSEPIQS